MEGDRARLPASIGQHRRPEAFRTRGARARACARAVDVHGFNVWAAGFLLIASLAALWPAAARGEADTQPAQDSATFVSLTVDNDFFAGFDRHYTNGLQLALSADMRNLPEGLRSLPPLRWSTEPRFTFSLGQRIYTPAEKELTDPDPLDRPYAGWLYALAEVRTRTGATVDHLQASIAIIGPASLAEQTQNTYHSLVGAERARGWDEQLGNEPAFLMAYERAWPALGRASFKALEADFTPRAGVTAGNVFTYASSGMVAGWDTICRTTFPQPTFRSARRGTAITPPGRALAGTRGSVRRRAWSGGIRS
jgi:hypothetical protein